MSAFVRGLFFLCSVSSTVLLAAGCGSEASPNPVVLEPETLQNVARVLWMNEYDSSRVAEDIKQRLQSRKNSPEAFAERMSIRLDDLIADPDGCTPDYTPRHKMFKGYSANRMSPHQAYVMTTLLGPTSSRGYKQLPTKIAFSFPRDDRPQNEYQVGWHFFVGSASTASGEEFGVQLMFWHYTLLPPSMAATAGLSELENQVLEMHLAISKAGDRHYRAKPYVVAGTTGLIRFSSTPFSYEMGNNHMRSTNDGALFPIQLRAWGLDESGSSPVEIEIDITLNQTKGYVLNGDEGLSPSCGGVGTLYYSVPNLRIDPSVSTLRLDGQQLALSKGKFWYDHQYGTGFMPPGNPRSDLITALVNTMPRSADGWDWMMIQFDDDTELGLSALHSSENAGFYEQTGTNPPGTMTAGAYGVYVAQDGAYESVIGDIEVDQWIKSTVGYAPYLATDTWYPDRVRVVLESGVVPVERREFYLVPIVKTGQQGFFATGAQYSEGAVFVETAAGERIGRGFLESTGYASLTRQALTLGGISTDESTMKLLRYQSLTKEKAASCKAYLDEPGNRAQLILEIARCRGLPK